MEIAFSKQCLEMNERDSLAPSHRKASGRASPLPPLTYDHSFGRNGQLILDIGARQSTWVSSIIPLRNNRSKYLASYYETRAPGNPEGYTNNSRMVCFNSYGEVDTAFGPNGDGTVELRLGMPHYSMPKVIIEYEDGRLLVAGQHRSFGAAPFLHIMLSRLNPDGSVDSSFGNQGLANLTSLAQKAVWHEGTVILRDNTIVTAIALAEEGPPRSFLIKLTAEGQLDLSFGDQGLLEIKGLEEQSVASFGLLTTAETTRLLTYGFYLKTSKRIGFIAQLHTNGTPDAGFGVRGFMDVDSDEHNSILDVSVSELGPFLLIAGYRFNPELQRQDSLLFRATIKGEPDVRFNRGKPVYLGFHEASDLDSWTDARSLMDDAGRIVVFGDGGTATNRWSVAGRFHGTGEPDLDFVEGSSLGSPLNAEFFPSGSYVQGSNTKTVLCAGYAAGYAAVLAIVV